MIKAYTSGNTIIKIHVTPCPFIVSIVSRRTARLAIRKGMEWAYPIMLYRCPLVYKRIRVIGFQPDAGIHIGVWEMGDG